MYVSRLWMHFEGAPARWSNSLRCDHHFYYLQLLCLVWNVCSLLCVDCIYFFLHLLLSGRTWISHQYNDHKHFILDCFTFRWNGKFRSIFTIFKFRCNAKKRAFFVWFAFRLAGFIQMFGFCLVSFITFSHIFVLLCIFVWSIRSHFSLSLSKLWQMMCFFLHIRRGLAFEKNSVKGLCRV